MYDDAKAVLKLAAIISALIGMFGKLFQDLMVLANSVVIHYKNALLIC